MLSSHRSVSAQCTVPSVCNKRGKCSLIEYIHFSDSLSNFSSLISADAYLLSYSSVTAKPDITCMLYTSTLSQIIFFLLRTGFLLGLFFDLEVGGNISSETSVYFQYATRGYIREGITLFRLSILLGIHRIEKKSRIRVAYLITFV
jgi:hypothetical protein